MTVMSTTTRELRNAFQLAADLQRFPNEIRDAVRALKLEPASRYNGLPLYDETQQNAIERHLNHEAK